MKKILAMLLWVPLAVSCAAASSSVTPADLAGGVYILQSVNGAIFTSVERTPEIAFDETMRVAGQVCNRFMGQGTLKNDVLTVPHMATTMMLCTDERLNAMERDLADLLRGGATVTLDAATLTLRGDGGVYVYERSIR